MLAEAGDTCLSGEMLSGKLGLRPADVFRQIEALRTKGYRIDTVARQGYRLVRIPDRLSPLEISPFLTTHALGRGLHHFDSVASTNEVAFELAREGAFHGETVVAEHQTHGKGRRGRTWISPAGRNVYCSVILRPDVPPTRAPELTFVAAVAVVQTLREAFNVPADVKWPNDIEIQGKKISGILTELDAEGDEIGFVIVGLGINVNMEPDDFPEEIRSTATSLQIEVGDFVDRPLLTAALLARLEDWYDRWATEGPGLVLETLKIFSSTIGREVRILAADGAQGFDGTAEDIDESGALIVRRADGRTQKVVAADVEHLRRI